MTERILGILLLILLALAAAGTAAAHMTPPVVLVSDRDAVAGLLSGARKFFVRELRPSPDERASVQREIGWRPDEDFYRFYVGRDDAGRLVATTIFLTEFTIHGPIRVAVGIAPDGTLKGGAVTEVTEETYGWVKPLIDRQFTAQFAGRSTRDRFVVATPTGAGEPMTQFYAQVVASLMQRALALYQVAQKAGLS
jgi:Na+-translocating ferredoxin:NAD+ oxidoreductase RnfG subunit